jgi:hypothetical protein
VLIVTSRIAAGWGGCAAFATGILCFRFATGVVRFRFATGTLCFRFATGVVRFRFATGILLFGRAERVYGLSVYDGLGRRLIAQPLDVEKRTKGETPRLSVRRRAGQIEAVDMSQANLRFTISEPVRFDVKMIRDATGRVVEGSLELTPEEMIQYQNLRTDSDREEFDKTLEPRCRALLDDLARERKS